MTTLLMDETLMVKTLVEAAGFGLPVAWNTGVDAPLVIAADEDDFEDEEEVFGDDEEFEEGEDFEEDDEDFLEEDDEDVDGVDDEDDEGEEDDDDDEF